MKGKIMDGVETFLIGGIAAIIAYYSAKTIANYEKKFNKKEDEDEDADETENMIEQISI